MLNLKYSIICGVIISMGVIATPVKAQTSIGHSAEQNVSTATSEFDCERLYSNYQVAMSSYAKPKKKKKRGFLKGVGKSMINNAGTVAGLSGVDILKVKKINDASEIASIATGQSQNDPSQMIAAFGTASSAIELQRTSMRLALENGCDVGKLTVPN